MAIKKQYFKTKSYAKVTLSLPQEAAPNATLVNVVGDFNDWKENADAMAKLKSGDFKIELNLAPGKEYQFRYLIDNKIWENDWEADNYVMSSVSAEDNSVIVL